MRAGTASSFRTARYSGAIEEQRNVVIGERRCLGLMAIGLRKEGTNGFL